VKLQFNKQQYQIDCVNIIVNIFEKLANDDDLKLILQNHSQKNNYTNVFSGQRNIDIMMETGTGKTFTFINTMFELNKQFGYKKFIVLVPSIAIMEGTKKNLEITKQYFQDKYSKEIQYRSNVSWYITNPNIFSVLIMTPHSFNKKGNILNKAHERELPFKNVNTMLGALKSINPIVVIDEPHKFDGKQFKEYFEGFDNYFLRFGATFPKKDKKTLELSNVAYVLNSIDAFRQCLVKRIQVFTEEIANDGDILKSIDYKAGKIEIMTNQSGQKIKVSRQVGEPFNGITIKEIKTKNIILGNGESYRLEDFEYHLTHEGMRQMINNTINLHFEKEEQLFEKGIKVLSLFFVRNINDFRGKKPIIKQIFEEEYTKIWSKKIQNASGEYKAYLINDIVNGNLNEIHKGYFSGDTKSEEQDIDLILKDKERLLSFETQTRFIFSVWALQEGWDNPNVFQICKLSNYGSDNSRLQQIGRGLRLCVNHRGIRQTRENIADEEDFWELNTLSVIIPASEDTFVSGIQNEIAQGIGISQDEFTLTDVNKVLAHAGISTRNGRVFLEENNIIVFSKEDNGEEYYKKIENYKENLKGLNPNEYISQENIEQIRKMFEFDTITQYIKSGKYSPQKIIKIKESKFKDFEILWNQINKKAYYTVRNLQQHNRQELTKKIADEISQVKVSQLKCKTIKHTHNSKENVFEEGIYKTHNIENSINLKKFAVGLSQDAKIPLDFVVEIFQKVDRGLQDKIKTNERQANAEIIAIIKNKLIENIKTIIDYHFTKGEISTVAQREYKGGTIGKQQENYPSPFHLKEQWIFEDVIAWDSELEKDIICEASHPKIKIFGKMPRLEIETPLGKYSPDFCYTIETERGKKIILIVEAKGYNTSQDIPQNEMSKISFAEKFFEALNKEKSECEIHYKKRINKADLSSIISEIIN
jgi:type III restriction enzyme